MEPLGWGSILARIAFQLWPVWAALALTFAASIRYKRRLGLYGKLFDSPIGMAGFAIVMFWVFSAIFADQIITFDPLGQISGLKNKSPGMPAPEGASYGYYLLGGDNLARDVFSRMIMGARRVLAIAPAATTFAFMVGISLGLPAGYFAGRLDTALSFVANLVLAFPTGGSSAPKPSPSSPCSTAASSPPRNAATSMSASPWCLASGPIPASPSTPIPWASGQWTRTC